MSKFIKAIVASAAILFAFSTNAAHAENIKPVKGCGYEIFKGADKGGNVIKLCLHSNGGNNAVTIFLKGKKDSTFDVSDVKFIHTVMGNVMEANNITILVPNSRRSLAFKTLQSGNTRAANLEIWSGPNPSSSIPFKYKTVKMNLVVGGHPLNDYGIERRGPGASGMTSNIIKAPSM